MSTTQFGLTSTGYTPKRAADVFDDIKARFIAELARAGLPTDVDFERDRFLGPFTLAIATVLEEAEDLNVAMFDAWVPNNATGLQLDNQGLLTGVLRNEATRGTATVTLSGTAGTVVPANSIVSGGGTDGLARWLTTTTVTIGVGGTIDVIVQAEQAGTIVATIGQITTVVTPVSGWTSVTNAVAAEPGRDDETDAAYRQRRAQSQQIRGSASLKAIRAKLLDLDYLTNVIVFDNDRDFVQTLNGKVLAPHSVSVVVFPDPTTTARRTEVARVIYKSTLDGIYLNGSDVVATVTDPAGAQKTVRYDIATTFTVTVDMTITLDAGFQISDVQGLISETLLAENDELSMGEELNDTDVIGLVAAIDGVRRVVSVTLNGANTVSPTIIQLPQISIVTVSL